MNAKRILWIIFTIVAAPAIIYFISLEELYKYLKKGRR